MDSNELVPFPIFCCKVKQDGNCIYLPVPFGTLEGVVRSLLTHNPRTTFEIVAVDYLKENE